MSNVKEMDRELRKREETKNRGGWTKLNTFLFLRFWVWYVRICIFLIFLPETRLSKMQFRLLNHLKIYCGFYLVIFQSSGMNKWTSSFLGVWMPRHSNWMLQHPAHGWPMPRHPKWVLWPQTFPISPALMNQVNIKEKCQHIV